MNEWGIAAVTAGALFTGAVVYFALMRVPRWRVMEVGSFLPDFERTINVADKVQPMLLVITIASTALFLGSTEGSSRLLSLVAIAGFSLTMLGSLAVMVPLQRRIIRLGNDPTVPLGDMRTRWFRGHIGRASLAIASFVSLVAAVVQTS